MNKTSHTQQRHCRAAFWSALRATVTSSGREGSAGFSRSKQKHTSLIFFFLVSLHFYLLSSKNKETRFLNEIKLNFYKQKRANKKIAPSKEKKDVKE